jgi:hypothetical protein
MGGYVPAERIAQLLAKLAARTEDDGRHKIGFKHNVQALKREIARLRRQEARDGQA